MTAAPKRKRKPKLNARKPPNSPRAKRKRKKNKLSRYYDQYDDTY